jgi:alpha-glucan phosphorylase-like protein
MKTVAYFSAEYSVADNLPIYAGGLGILAGDTVQEAGLQNRSFYALGLIYHEAFTTGDPDTTPMTSRLGTDGFSIMTDADHQPLTVMIPLDDELVKVRAWRKSYGTAQLILLDTHVEGNSDAAQALTDHLYDGTIGIMLRQQVLLGFGGVAMLEALGVTPDTYHLNEGHMAFAGLAAAVAYQRAHPATSLEAAFDAVKPQLVATKHTILPGAGLTLDRSALEAALKSLLVEVDPSLDYIMKHGAKKDGYFSTTKFLIAMAGHHSGVSAIHVKAEAKTHAGSPLVPVTNGVFVPRWRAASLDGNPLAFDDRYLWEMHEFNRHTLLDYVRTQTGKTLDRDHLTVVWARRMTAYKRPELLVNDLTRLIDLAHHAQRPVQFVVAGKANPADSVGFELMRRVIATSQHAQLADTFAYLPNYNPMTARLLVQGADLWLNTPIRGQEACGTSGMKASLNGALQFSTSDGWIDEVEIAPIGWKLPVEQTETALYDLLEHEVAPLFYGRRDNLPTGWIKKMRANIRLIEDQFTTTRMLEDYYDKLYQ